MNSENEWSWLEEKLPAHFEAKVATALFSALVAAIVSTKDHCIDNIRFAAKDNAVEVAAYESARNHGCCGFYDAETVLDGKTYLIGFNYGH